MTLQASGSISFSDLATEYGDTAPHSMSEFYKGAGLVNASYSFSATASNLNVLSSSFGSRPGYDVSPTISRTNEIYYHVRWCDGCAQSVTLEFDIDQTGTYVIQLGGYLQLSGQYNHNEIWVNGTKTHDYNLYFPGVSSQMVQNNTVSLTAGDTIKIVNYHTAAPNKWCSVFCSVGGNTVGTRIVSDTGNTTVPTSGAISLTDFYGGENI